MTISILGCGWLGFPLAKSLLKKGFLVKGSTTTLEKISVMENAGIDAFHIALSEVEIVGEMDAFLSNSEILIIDIPPKLRGNSNENFVAKIQNLIPFIEKSSVEKVIFVSSTSVYSDAISIDLITEKTIPNPDTESGKQLLEAEKILQNNSNFRTTVIRFGGLIGEDRHPIKFLAGRENLENPEAPINLIHQLDCIGIITEILEKNCFGKTFNAVSPFHPTRKVYYSKKALELNLPLPKFDESKPSVGKIISSEKIETVLKYTFQKPEL
ncbi:Rossmann-fold NAD(P)-binding domain-containing protein [Flavobacterium solisilvae]|uniref:NAD(P)H-binding protein n=1 Tax=Flavobacterium solisilvae TaxID=1852019 RepID=A0ABX1QW41_9FLAO|nr:NAD(P)H-binding protein [Flavobacterium solisilvae]NMH25705.1 NAD(P)H-binding protein [Flavobacterium solisilvae]